MTRQEFLDFHEKCCARMVATTQKKNADYTGGSANEDPFANFTEVELLNIASTEQGFLTRMSDKFARIRSFVKKGVLLVEDESVEDTLIDLANYSILMAGYIRSKKQRASADADHIDSLVASTERPVQFQKLGLTNVNQLEEVEQFHKTGAIPYGAINPQSENYNSLLKEHVAQKEA